MPDSGSPLAKFDHLGRLPPRTGWAMAEHAHADFHEMIVVLHGEIITRIRGKVLHGRRGDVLFYPAGEAHAEQAAGDEPLETLFLGWQWIAGTPPPHADWPLIVNDRSGRIQMIVHWLREIVPPTRPADAGQIQTLLDALLYEYQHLAQPPEQALIEQVKTYIRRNLAESLTLDRLARQAGLSKYHFSREFKRLTGQSPMAYLRQERVEAARSLLLSTPLTLQAIARQVGLTDEFQLSRVFHRLTGQPPSRLRRGG